MKATRTVFPRVLNINADIIAPFDFDALYSECIVASIDSNHSLRSRICSLCGRNFDQGLEVFLPLIREARQGFCCHDLHLFQELLSLGIEYGGGKNCAVPMSFSCK